LGLSNPLSVRVERSRDTLGPRQTSLDFARDERGWLEKTAWAILPVAQRWGGGSAKH